MKSLFSLFVGLGGLALAGCHGSASVTCQKQSCGSGTTTTFEACADKATAEYHFGGTSCSCPAGDANACMGCAAMVDAYCSGTSGDGGAPMDGSVPTDGGDDGSVVADAGDDGSVATDAGGDGSVVTAVSDAGP